MKMGKSMKKICAEIEEFRVERDWVKFHNEKDLAISISLEASELLEVFQWKQSSEVLGSKLQNVKEELADVLIYSCMLANNLGLDVEEIIQNKLAINRLKYPVEKSYGSNKKYTDFDSEVVDGEI